LSYEQLDTVARLQADVGPEPGAHAGVKQPAVYTAANILGLEQFNALGQQNIAQAAMQNIANSLAVGGPGLAVELVHPWALSERGAATAALQQGERGLPQTPLRIGIIHTPAHARWPWSLRRWEFVLARMQAVCDVVFIGDAAQLAQCPGWPGKQRVGVQSTLFEGYRDVLPRLATLRSAPTLFAPPGAPCTSFSKFYERVQRAQPDFSKLFLT
jgi:deoxyribodipyrimidine photo-lyase